MAGPWLAILVKQKPLPDMREIGACLVRQLLSQRIGIEVQSPASWTFRVTTAVRGRLPQLTVLTSLCPAAPETRAGTWP